MIRRKWSKDFIYLSGLLLLYLIITFYNLGSRDVPSTYWQGEETGLIFEIRFHNPKDVEKLYIYNGIAEGIYRIDAMSNGEWHEIVTWNASENFPKSFSWESKALNIKGEALRFYLLKSGGSLMEMQFYDKSGKLALSPSNVKEIIFFDKNSSKLFDEQSKNVSDSYLYNSYFDEIYFARTAFEITNDLQRYEITHPNLSKLFMIPWIKIFGMTPFGWRFGNFLIGAAIVLIFYIFSKNLFSNSNLALLSGVLITFDFMHFSLSRIGTSHNLELFMGLTTIFFAYNFYKTLDYKNLLLSAIFFGAAISVKWNGFFYVPIILLILIFSLIKIKERHKTVKFLIFTPLFFITIPIVIYFATYLPDIIFLNRDFSDILNSQFMMLKYHSSLQSSHPFSSEWYSWPFIWKPIWMFKSIITENIVSTIVLMGNPAIWWFGVFTILFTTFSLFFKFDERAFFIISAFWLLLFPYLFISRVMFIYHFYHALPYLILSIIYFFYYYRDSRGVNYFKYIFIFTLISLFILFYPAISGLPIEKEYVESYLRWFKDRWYF